MERPKGLTTEQVDDITNKLKDGSYIVIATVKAGENEPHPTAQVVYLDQEGKIREKLVDVDNDSVNQHEWSSGDILKVTTSEKDTSFEKVYDGMDVFGKKPDDQQLARIYHFVRMAQPDTTDAMPNTMVVRSSRFG